MFSLNSALECRVYAQLFCLQRVEHGALRANGRIFTHVQLVVSKSIAYLYPHQLPNPGSGDGGL